MKPLKAPLDEPKVKIPQALRLRVKDFKQAVPEILIESGVPVTTTAKRLGHSTPATTTKVYAHTIASMDAKAAEFFDTILPIPKQKTE